LFPCCIGFFVFLRTLWSARSSSLSLHDALPISPHPGLVLRVRGGGGEHDPAGDVPPLRGVRPDAGPGCPGHLGPASGRTPRSGRSEEHTSELQSRENLVCRLLLEKKKENKSQQH